MKKMCSMCTYTVVITPGLEEVFGPASESLWEKHYDDHVRDFQIEMLMTLDA